MAAADDFVSIPGSEHTQPAEATVLGPVDPAEVIKVNVMVRHKVVADRQPLHELVAEIGDSSPLSRKSLTHEQYENLYGADPDDVAKVVQFARESGLEVDETSLSKRTIRLSGPIQSIREAFQVELKRYQMGKETYRGRSGTISVPRELGPIVTGVFGLDDRPMYRPMIESSPRPPRSRGISPLIAGDSPPFTPEQVASFYNFPTSLDGTGQTIGIIELGGGFFAQDLQAFANPANFPRRIDPTATMTLVHVPDDQQAPNAPDPNGALAAYSENLLDIEIISALAPKAKIVVYFATDMLAAVSTAVDDSVNKPKVISISWGNPEDPANLGQYYANMEQVFLKAASLNITICVSSGDHGAAPGVSHPACSPNVLACGGTTLTQVSGGKIIDEDAWSGSGGGVSVTFPTIPLFQAAIGIPQITGRTGRGVPDVSGNANSATGYDIISAAVPLGMMGGTSAVAPLWAALIALFNQDLASQSPGSSWGYLNPILYGFAATPPTADGPFRDIVSGSNGFSAGIGWDAVTGLGSPNGAKLLELLQAAASVGS